MALQLTYSSLVEQYSSNKPGTIGTVAGTTNINVPQLAPITLPLTDVVFESGTTVKSADGLNSLGIISTNGGSINGSSKPSIILNSDRIIINSKTDHTMVFGQLGVALSSPNKVNIDADDSVTIHGESGVYLGVPNKGEGVPPDSQNNPKQKTKASPTPNYDYEPMVLGLKLANWLDDLLQVLKNSVVLTPVGKGYFREDTQYDLIALQARIKEMLSTYAFVDGHSHEQTEEDTIPPPPVVTETTNTLTGEISGTVVVESLEQQTSGDVQDNLAKTPGYTETVNTNTSIK